MKLVKGSDKMDLLFKPDMEEEAWIFKKVFGANWRKGLALHSLLSLPPSELIDGIASHNVAVEATFKKEELEYKIKKHAAI